MLKMYVKTLEEVAEPFREEYEPAGEGKEGFILKIEDREYKTKLDEFRTNNRELHKKVQALEADVLKYKDIDPERARKALEELSKLEESEEGRMLKEGKFDEVFNRRTTAMKQDHERQLKEIRDARAALEQENTAMKSQLSRLLIDTKVTEVVGKVGALRPGAQQDVLNRARNTFSIENGAVVPKSPNNGEVTYGTNGEPISIEEWGQRLLQDAAYLFEGSVGGGASGGEKGNGKTSGDKDEKVLTNPDAATMGANLEDIASGKKKVILTQK